MKIVLSTSPHIKHSAVLEADFEPAGDLMYTFAPLGLLMLAASLRKGLGITPVIFDINKNINNDVIKKTDDFYQSAAEAILQHQPEVVGFMTECDSYHHVLQICEKIKETNSDCYIVLGGPHASAVAAQTISKWKCVDCIVLGEGENTFPELIEKLSKNSQEVVSGTVTRDGNGNCVKGAPRTLVESLDELPFPAYDLYAPVLGEELFLEAGRGCPFKCTFCSTAPFWERKSRVKSPDRIVKEIQYIKDIHPVKRIHFTHDLFTANAAWVENVCFELREASLGVSWTCSSRIDTVSERLLSRMKEAGCDAVFFGVESGSERVLTRIKKNIPTGKTLEVLDLCRDYGINSNAGLIVGFPFEDQESFSETFALYLRMLKRETKPVHLFSYCPFVQSDLYGSLDEMKSSEHFLDVPLSETLNLKNRELVNSDEELFGSYFKPNIPALAKIKPGMLPAVDEFALLVDAVQIPSMAIAENVGGMEELFYLWTDFISQKNQNERKPVYRKYFGSPVDFCGFLLRLFSTLATSEKYLESLLRVHKINFEIASNLKLPRQPLTMANYKSETLPSSLSQPRAESKLGVTNVIASIQIGYDITRLLNRSVLPKDFVAEQKTTNLVWQHTGQGNVSLVSVSDFLYFIIQRSKTNRYSVTETINDWVVDLQNRRSEPDFEEIFCDIQVACENKIIEITS